MKVKQLITVVGGVVLAGVGVSMALTNPGRDAYQEYATEKLSVYLKESVCTQAPQAFGGFLQRQCTILVDTGRPQIQQIIAETTERQNYLIFSIYTTNLSFNPVLPAYEFRTIGAFESFFIYQAEQL